jgi:hypothetical protein
MSLGRTRRELLLTTSSRELNEWLAFFSLEPFGPYADNLNAGIVACAAASAFGGKKKGGGTLSPYDFTLGDFKMTTSGKQTVEEQKKLLMAMVDLTKGKDNMKKKRVISG